MFKREALWMLLGPFVMAGLGLVATLIVPSLIHFGAAALAAPSDA